MSFRTCKRVIYCGFAAMVGLSLAGVPGCSRSSLGDVTGKVTSNDQPVSLATLKLWGQDAAKPQQQVVTGIDGFYTLTNVPPGEYKITLESNPQAQMRPGGNPSAMTPEQMKEAMKAYGKGKGGAEVPQAPGEMQQPNFVTIPSQYSDPKKTPISLTVKAGKQTKDIPLTE
jgi:hypothetical protein